MKNQMNVSVWRDELAQLRTNKKEFLEQTERLIPWGEWKGIIEPHYYKGERGNKPYDLELMLRLFAVQKLYSKAETGHPPSEKGAKILEYRQKSAQRNGAKPLWIQPLIRGVVKNLFGYRKTRYRGLAKQNAKLNVMFALANLNQAGKRGLAA